VVVAGFTEDVQSAIELAEFIKPMQNVEKVELLPYHALGEHKWQSFGEQYTLANVSAPSAQTMQQLQQVFLDRGIKATY
jgi:pyruvate formate lyase activating enzyme